MKESEETATDLEATKAERLKLDATFPYSLMKAAREFQEVNGDAHNRALEFLRNEIPE